MKALLSKNPGGPETLLLEDIPEPIPGSGEVRIAVRACGVGLAAVELGKVMGARVVAAASSAEKLALARDHGADEGVQYPAGPLDKTQARRSPSASRSRAAASDREARRTRGARQSGGVDRQLMIACGQMTARG
jgi:NADPH:quinone reductase-like Zn-dependent oxidoreductase